MSQLSIVKPKTAIEKRTNTTVDTIMVTPERVAKWKLPSGQRPLRENQKVKELANKIIGDGGVIPGMLSIGVFSGDNWVIDGQHRLHAFKLSELKEGYADVRFLHADSMSEINREYVELNSKLVNMRPDDFLRGLEGSIESLAAIRKRCPFVGYDQIRRNGNSGPIVSMAATLRNWKGSAMETPGVTSVLSSVDLAGSMTDEDTKELTNFLVIAKEAFGMDPEYARLWTALNMVLCMWMYRKLVLTQYSPRIPRLDRQLFTRCMMSLSADRPYQDWLFGRRMTERDRAPAYSKIKTIFGKRIEKEMGKKIHLPQPEWGGR